MDARPRIRNQQQLVVVPMRGKAASLNIGLPEVRAKWAQKLKDWGAACVILDCLRPVLDALNMSEDKDASKFLGHFDAMLLEAGVPDAAVIHHAGHGSDRARGDSGILGWSDATWGLSLEDPQDQASPRYFKAYGRIDRDIPDAKLASPASSPGWAEPRLMPKPQQLCRMSWRFSGPARRPRRTRHRHRPPSKRR